jgi:hypothetical protein
LSSDDHKKQASGGGGGGGFSGGGGFAAPVSDQGELLLFGGRNHDVFLGCLNCNEYDNASVFNSYGPHGGRYQTESIFNRFGDYSSRYSDYRACNSYGSDPPIIVDRQGQAYGRLTLNRFAHQVNAPETIAWLKGVYQL